MNDTFTFAIGICIALACAWYVVLALFRGGNRRSEDEQALEDMEQSIAVSRPAPLHPHVKAGTAYGKPLQ